MLSIALKVDDHLTFYYRVYDKTGWPSLTPPITTPNARALKPLIINKNSFIIAFFQKIMLYYLVYAPNNVAKGQIYDCQFAAERAQVNDAKLRIKTFESQTAARRFMNAKTRPRKARRTLGLDGYIYVRPWCNAHSLMDDDQEEEYIEYGADIILSDGTREQFSKIKEHTNVTSLGEILAIKNVSEQYPQSRLYVHTQNQDIVNAYNSFRAGQLGRPNKSTQNLFILFNYLNAYKCVLSTDSPFGGL